ncbi:hypothetical protein MLD38_007094 [Melastoma candidum]|uniref:Uncharacterized protein n=1 Tax=Melastoma candidum TaxID=119954 RepID=A0ACB9RPZ8_9MYRT|nr:hypothetical protein MLD38_007094 [Melastoma candidum]
MASRTVSTAVFLLSMLFLSAVSNACSTCTLPPPPKPKPTPCPTPAVPVPTPVTPARCPIDTLKLAACADVLGLVNVVIGTPPTSPCCALLGGLVDLEVALCLCIAIKANILGINLDIPVSLSAIVSACQKTVPPGFQCP